MFIIKSIFSKRSKSVVIKRTELQLQLILLNFFGIKRHTCKLSSQLDISFIFIVEKRLLFRSQDLRFSSTGSLLSELFVAVGSK